MDFFSLPTDIIVVSALYNGGRSRTRWFSIGVVQFDSCQKYRKKHSPSLWQLDLIRLSRFHIIAAIIVKTFNIIFVLILTAVKTIQLVIWPILILQLLPIYCYHVIDFHFLVVTDSQISIKRSCGYMVWQLSKLFEVSVVCILHSVTTNNGKSKSHVFLIIYILSWKDGADLSVMIKTIENIVWQLSK